MIQQQQQEQRLKNLVSKFGLTLTLLTAMHMLFIPIRESLTFQDSNSYESIKITISDLDFSPDGQTLASGGSDGTVKLWNVATGKKLKTLKGHLDKIYSVSFSPDGERIASASADKTIKIWSRDGNLIKVLLLKDGQVTNVSFCPDNQFIVFSSADNTISLWGVDGKLVKTLTVGSSIRNAACSPDSKIIAVASDDNRVRLWNRNGQKLQTLNNRGEIYFISDKKAQSQAVKNGSVISTATTGQGNAGNISINSVYKALYKASFAQVEGNGNSNSTSNTVENDRTITASIGSDNTLKLFTKYGLLLHTLEHNKPVRTFAFHPNHKIIASGCDDGKIYFWNVNTGQLILDFQAYENKVSRIAYSLDGRRVTSTSDDGVVKVWYPDSFTMKSGFAVVIVALVLVFSGSAVLFVVTKRRQSKRHNNTSNTQSNYIITGWVVCVLPEDWRGNLEALRYELITAKNPTWYVRFITVTTLLDMLYGGIRVKLQNLYYGDDLIAVTGRRSITDSKNNSANHKDLNE